MPVDASMPVFPPQQGAPIKHEWGNAVSEHVVQRFASAAERDAKWSNPPRGAKCTTVDQLQSWTFDGNVWIPDRCHFHVGFRDASVPGSPGAAMSFEPTTTSGTPGVSTLVHQRTISGSPTPDALEFPLGGLWMATVYVQVAGLAAGAWGKAMLEIVRGGAVVWRCGQGVSNNPGNVDRQTVTFSMMLGLLPGDQVQARCIAEISPWSVDGWNTAVGGALGINSGSGMAFQMVHPGNMPERF